jgi:hypothetical protein
MSWASAKTRRRDFIERSAAKLELKRLDALAASETKP